MKITTYIKKNWKTLPKSTFNSEEFVMFSTLQDEHYGYGAHTYEGYGCNEFGQVFWCYSSGCSCEGTCSTKHQKDLKTFKVYDTDVLINKIDYKSINFKSLQVFYSDY